MTVNYDLDKLYDPNYTIGVLCSEFSEQFGTEGRKIISQICRQRGLALGKILTAKQKEKSFESAINSFVAASEKTNEPAKLVTLEENRAILQGRICPLGLKDRGRKICELMMAIDQGILEAASGREIKFRTDKSLAAGDDYCEVIFEVA